jgi:hypothetical protein
MKLKKIKQNSTNENDIENKNSLNEIENKTILKTKFK